MARYFLLLEIPTISFTVAAMRGTGLSDNDVITPEGVVTSLKKTTADYGRAEICHFSARIVKQKATLPCSDRYSGARQRHTDTIIPLMMGFFRARPTVGWFGWLR